ncbi:uncharacterized [Tachysurus ichikawai]
MSSNVSLLVGGSGGACSRFAPIYPSRRPAGATVESGARRHNRGSDNHSNSPVPSCHAVVEMGAVSTETT